LDYDNVKDVSKVLQTIKDLATTRAAFKSPSGNGVKVFIKVDTEAKDHRRAWEAVRASYDLMTGVESDEKVKDIPRLCFMSHDPDAYYNKSSSVFSVTEYIESSTDQTNQLDWIANLTSKYQTFVEGSRNSYVFQYACISNRRGISESETLNYCINNYLGPSFDESEITRTVNSAYKNNFHEHNTQGLKPIYHSTNGLLSAKFDRKTKNAQILDVLSKSIVINQNSGQVFQLCNGAI
jgi:hypothetical protein